MPSPANDPQAQPPSPFTTLWGWICQAGAMLWPWGLCVAVTAIFQMLSWPFPMAGLLHLAAGISLVRPALCGQTALWIFGFAAMSVGNAILSGPTFPRTWVMSVGIWAPVIVPLVLCLLMPYWAQRMRQRHIPSARIVATFWGLFFSALYVAAFLAFATGAPHAGISGFVWASVFSLMIQAMGPKWGFLLPTSSLSFRTTPMEYWWVALCLGYTLVVGDSLSLDMVALALVPFVVEGWGVWRRWWPSLGPKRMLAVGALTLLSGGLLIAMIGYVLFQPWFQRIRHHGND